MQSEMRHAFLATFLAILLATSVQVRAGTVLPAEGKVETAFAPWDDVERLVMDQIDGARQAVYVQAHAVTSRRIAKTLIGARERGLTVEVIADRSRVLNDETSALPLVSGHGAMLWLDGRHGAARSSVMIIDPDGREPVVVTGSYDFGPTGAARNADNVIVLSGQRALAKAYMDNWKRHRMQSVSFADAVRATMGDEAAKP